MLDCLICENKRINNKTVRIRTAQGFMEPGQKYCLYNGKLKKIASKDIRAFPYPVWCPLNTCKNTCIQCGTRIREEEGEYCNTCK